MAQTSETHPQSIQGAKWRDTFYHYSDKMTPNLLVLFGNLMENMFYLVTHYLASPFVMLCHIFFFFLKILFIYLRETEWETENMRGRRVRGRGGLPAEQGARCGTRSRDSGIVTWAEGSRLTNWATQAPQKIVSLSSGFLGRIPSVGVLKSRRRCGFGCQFCQ